jgi:hypothetical protein
MNIRLIRQASETPQITNKDDARMIRFAYGGLDGVVRGFGKELSHDIIGSRLRLNNGCVVLQGWEVMVDSWELDVSTVISTQYYTIYLEVDVASELATIKSTYQLTDYSVIDKGNDLTNLTTGIARLPLYTFVVTNGRISSVVRKFSFLSYYGERLDRIEQRLIQLGFKEGTVALNYLVSSAMQKNNSLNRQGNYVIGKLSLSGMAVFTNSQNLIDGYVEIGNVPEEFLPTEDVYIPCHVNYHFIGIGTSYLPSIIWYLVIDTAGKVKISISHLEQSNAEISEINAVFGYEAKPLI